jgi:nucleotide-binding universal stress UspA family protein
MASKLFTIATVKYSRALILQSLLEREGVKCILVNVNLLQPDASSGVKVKVNEEDLEKGMKIASRLKIEFGEDLPKNDVPNLTRILVPVDFSEFSKNASIFALNVARNYPGSELRLLYVYYAPEMDAVPYSETYIFSGPVTEQGNEIRERAQSNIENLSKELKNKIQKQGIQGVKVDYSLVQGSAADSILYFTESYHPDLIIVGAKGSGMRDSFLGSSTMRVVLKAHFPVLVIPENTRFDSEKKEYNLMYATNFDEADFIAISKLMRLMSKFKVKIFCTHIGTMAKDPWKKMKFEGLKNYFTENYPDVKISCQIIESENIITGLDKFISENSVDILSLTTHRRNLLNKIINPSLTKKIFFQTNIPLLVFHSGFSL